MIDRDRLNNAPATDVAQATARLVDSLQVFPGHLQMLAAATLFTVVAKRYGAEPQDLFTIVGNMAADPIHGEREEFRALRVYAQHELTP